MTKRPQQEATAMRMTWTVLSLENDLNKLLPMKNLVPNKNQEISFHLDQCVLTNIQGSEYHTIPVYRSAIGTTRTELYKCTAYTSPLSDQYVPPIPSGTVRYCISCQYSPI